MLIKRFWNSFPLKFFLCPAIFWVKKYLGSKTKMTSKLWYKLLWVKKLDKIIWFQQILCQKRFWDIGTKKILGQNFRSKWFWVWKKLSRKENWVQKIFGPKNLGPNLYPQPVWRNKWTAPYSFSCCCCYWCYLLLVRLTWNVLLDLTPRPPCGFFSFSA